MECYDQSLLFILAGLGSDPFSSGKPCTANSTCNSDLGVMCCGEGTTYGRCCPDGLCKTDCTDSSDGSTFSYCGTVCPDYPKTTQSTPSYLSTTTATTTTTASTSNSSFVWNGELAMDYADEDED